MLKLVSLVAFCCVHLSFRKIICWDSEAKTIYDLVCIFGLSDYKIWGEYPNDSGIIPDAPMVISILF